jgi:hypothetical protein
MGKIPQVGNRVFGTKMNWLIAVKVIYQIRNFSHFSDYFAKT